jgi:hypothetical protein
MPSLNTGNAILSNAIAVDSSYNVGIGGAASGTNKLQVTGIASANSFIPTSSTIPSNGMYLSAANTLNFATNTTNRLTIGSTGVATFSSNIFAGGSILTSPSGADTIIGAYGGQDCSLILQDAVQAWELYVNDDFYINRGSTTALSISRTTGAATFSSTINCGDITTNGNNKGLYFNGTRNAILGNASTEEVVIATANATRMTITSGGNVGIGTSSPESVSNFNTLQVDGTSGAMLRTGTSAYGGYVATIASADVMVISNVRNPINGTFSNTGKAASVISLYGESGNGYMTFNTSNVNNTAPTTRMTITNGGNVSINNLLYADRISLSNFVTLYGTKVVKGDAVTSLTINLASIFPEMSNNITSGGNTVGVFGRFTIFRSGACETGIFSICRNSGGSWSSGAYATQAATGAFSLGSVAGSGSTSILLSFNTTVYVMVEITTMIE